MPGLEPIRHLPFRHRACASFVFKAPAAARAGIVRHGADEGTDVSFSEASPQARATVAARAGIGRHGADEGTDMSFSEARPQARVTVAA